MRKVSHEELEILVEREQERPRGKKQLDQKAKELEVFLTENIDPRIEELVQIIPSLAETENIPLSTDSDRREIDRLEQRIHTLLNEVDSAVSKQLRKASKSLTWSEYERLEERISQQVVERLNQVTEIRARLLSRLDGWHSGVLDEYAENTLVEGVVEDASDDHIPLDEIFR